MSSTNFIFVFIARLKNFLIIQIPIFKDYSVACRSPINNIRRFSCLILFNLGNGITSLREVGAVRGDSAYRHCELPKVVRQSIRR